MPEPLVCEDTSLTRLMETVHKTPGARILYQDTVRRGGVFGFFAREVHRVAYLAGDQPDLPAAQPVETAEAAVVTDAPADPIASLLAAAEAAEARLRQPAAGRGPAEPSPAGDFASVLRRYVAESEDAESELTGSELTESELAGSQLPESGLAGSWIAESVEKSTDALAIARATGSDVFRPDAIGRTEATDPAEPKFARQPIAEVTPLGSRGRDGRNRLELLMQLRQVGVPISLNPAGGVQSPYEALEDILGQLPPAPRLPHRAGQLIVIAGDGAAALHAARVVSRMQRLPLRSIVTAGLETAVGGSLRRIKSPEEAMRLREELISALTPSVLVVATDGAGLGPDDSWPAEIVRALRPDMTWAVVDARWKVEDSQLQLARLPHTDALVVHSAELSGSPASVWELGLPIGLLDDQRPYSFTWLGMLLRLLGDSSRHQATA